MLALARLERLANDVSAARASEVVAIKCFIRDVFMSEVGPITCVFFYYIHNL